MYFHLTTLVNVDRQSVFIYLNDQNADHILVFIEERNLRHNLRNFLYQLLNFLNYS